MLGMKLVRLIEVHSEDLSRTLAQRIRSSDRTSDFRKIPEHKLELAAADLYCNLGEWLLQKTDSDISGRFETIAARRASEGIRLHQFVWALILTRDLLWNFLRQHAFADSIVQVYGQLELYDLLNQFFDRAMYHAVRGYSLAGEVGQFASKPQLEKPTKRIGPPKGGPILTEN